MDEQDSSHKTKSPTEVLKVELPVVDSIDSHEEEVDTTMENPPTGAHEENISEAIQQDVIMHDTRGATNTTDNINPSHNKTIEADTNQNKIGNELGVDIAERNKNATETSNKLQDTANNLKLPEVNTKVTEQMAKLSEGTEENKHSKRTVLGENVKNNESVTKQAEHNKDYGKPSNIATRPVVHQRKQTLALTAEEEDLGIYEDTAEGDDLTDTEIETLKAKFRSVHSKLEPIKQEKVIDKSENKLEVRKDNEDAKLPKMEISTSQINPEVVRLSNLKVMSAPKKIENIQLKYLQEGLAPRGKTISCITDVFQESRNASRLALESREAMFRRAMTLLSARCTSVKQGVDAGDSNAPFGIQVPKYFYVTQEKPFPMEPLKAWRGYNGNVYFEPIQVNPLKQPLSSENLDESPKDTGRLPSKQMERPSSESDKVPIKPAADSRSESRQTIKSSISGNRPSPRQMVILDKQTVINRFNESLHEDIVFLEGQENTGSLAIRPRTQPSQDKKKDLLYNKERICKGSVAHKLYVEKHPSSRRPRFSVSGGKFTPPNSMSPLLRTQTQYSLSSHRLTTNSPDLYHLNDSKLPPLDQIKASLKHSGGSGEKLYTRPLTITAEMKPFVKYSPDVVAKFAQQAL